MKYTAMVCGLFFGVLAAGCREMSPRPCVPVGQHPAEAVLGETDAAHCRYLLYLPEQYATRDKWPMILFLHGAGERGDDINRVKIHGPPKLIDQGRSFPFIVVSPQCPEGQFWDVQMLGALLDKIESEYAVDPDRIYVTGLSMGGYGTWAMAAAYPSRLAAIAPICGGGDPGHASRIRHLPVWVFHGDQDRVVAISRSQEMVDALKACGGDVTFTVYPGVGHDSWTRSYDQPDLYDWFLKHRRGRACGSAGS